MKYRKLQAILLVFIMVLSLAGCQKVDEKISEKVVEEIIGSATGGKIDIKKDGLKLETGDTEMEVGDELEWPVEAMGDLPVPKARFDFIMKNDENKSCTVTFKDLDEDDGRAYFDILVEMGFKGGTYLNTDDILMFSGSRENGTGVNYNYNPISKEGFIIFEITQ
ncbi:hypothetical protein [Alkaliphilus peptidifermentans]|uniref:Lipoprotein n=1 Tax=Alkaliphilus peptidifermentans DSM 18978 TaxID=1120976 RepID=A0A1G5ILW1_9FIRM|nr:hypothetical protein [Alkaliphilus peptidifermentans]SCY76731.1 hypothetical protein SAMN03080606_02438 [Alkaliphilus peptidifermentans DSM 18978]